MATISIWPGSASFDDTTNPTPFGFYDDDVAGTVIILLYTSFIPPNLDEWLPPCCTPFNTNFSTISIFKSAILLFLL